MKSSISAFAVFTVVVLFSGVFVTIANAQESYDLGGSGDFGGYDLGGGTDNGGYDLGGSSDWPGGYDLGGSSDFNESYDLGGSSDWNGYDLGGSSDWPGGYDLGGSSDWNGYDLGGSSDFNGYDLGGSSDMGGYDLGGYSDFNGYDLGGSSDFSGEGYGGDFENYSEGDNFYDSEGHAQPRGQSFGGQSYSTPRSVAQPPVRVSAPPSAPPSVRSNPIFSTPSYPPSVSYPPVAPPRPTPTPMPPIYSTPASNTNITTNTCTGNSCNTNINNIDNSINGSFNDNSVNGSFNTIVAKLSRATPQRPVQYVFPQQNLSCVIVASPNSVQSGQATTLSWSSYGASSAWLSDSLGTVSVNGSRMINPVSSRTYTLTVTGLGGTRTCATFVTVANTAPYVSLSQIPYTGFDAGPFSSVLYFGGLLAFAVSTAYLLLYYKGGMGFALGSILPAKMIAASSAFVAPAMFGGSRQSVSTPARKEKIQSREASPHYVGSAPKDSMTLSHSENGGIPRIVVSRS